MTASTILDAFVDTVNITLSAPRCPPGTVQHNRRSSLLAFHRTPRAAHDAATKACRQTLAEGLRVLPGGSLALLPRQGQALVITQVMPGMAAHHDRPATLPPA